MSDERTGIMTAFVVDAKHAAKDADRRQTTLYRDDGLQVEVINLPPGARTGGAAESSDVVVYCLKGEGQLVVDGHTDAIDEHSLAVVPKGSSYELLETHKGRLRALRISTCTPAAAGHAVTAEGAAPDTTETALAAAQRALESPTMFESMWRDAIVEALDQLGRALDDHIVRADGPGGFLDTSEAQAPHLIRRLEALSAEHSLLRNELSEARDAVAHSVGADGAGELVTMVSATLTRLDTHLGAANRLAMEIANRDIGPGD